MEALLRRSENCENRTGILIGMAACTLSGALVGFTLGLLLGLWL